MCISLQQIEYNSRDPEHVYEHKEKETIASRTFFAWIDSEILVIGVNLEVPSTISPTCILENTIINVSYHIRVCNLADSYCQCLTLLSLETKFQIDLFQVSASTCFCDPKAVVKVPITIGTHPIRNVELNQEIAPVEISVLGNVYDRGKRMHVLS